MNEKKVQSRKRNQNQTQKKSSKDILLNQWGIKHLHLTDKEANSIE